MRTLQNIIVLIILFGSSTSWSKDWFVLPEGEAQGSNDGTSYEDAWEGLHNVKWGVDGVSPGDNLYVCGLHVYEIDTLHNVATQADIKVASGSSDNMRVTIRGDCPNGDAGVVWGAFLMGHDSWRDEGGGVWSIMLPGNAYPDWFFQDIGKSDSKAYTVLKKQVSVGGVRQHPGSHFSESYKRKTKLYVSTVGNVNPAGRIYANRFGYEFVLGKSSYITFKNLYFMNMKWNTKRGPANITWDHCYFAYGEHSLLAFYDGSYGVQITNSVLTQASNGIYLISTTNNSPSNYLISGNYIYDIGVREILQNSDAHAIGVQGGTGGVIEKNFIKNVGTGPMLYAFKNQRLTNTVVRQNYITNTHNLGSALGLGVGTMCNNDSLSDKHGVDIHDNIVVNSTIGYRLQFEDIQNLRNNISFRNKYGLESSRNYNGKGARAFARGNIFLHSSGYHVNWYSGADDYLLNIDESIYFPVSGKIFRLGAREYRLFEWRRRACDGCVFDPTSITREPLFSNNSGQYENPADFKITNKDYIKHLGADITWYSKFAPGP